jgi:osmotically-inducible protein OsmY
MKFYQLLIVALITANLFYGCTPVVVGGAAAGGAAVYDRRTVGSFVDDEGVELKSRMAIFNDKELNSQIHINITSFNGIVLLSGEAPTAELRARAETITRGIEKVRLVHNEMSIAAPSSLMTRSSDTLITGKVKTSLFGIKGLEGFNPTRAKVVTENGTVYLMGMLYRSEAAAVTEKARQVSGVQRVVKLFEYLD